ncbi:MAG: T9SS type A sorting domain-containing protein [Flavobacteriales bacterium]
MRIRIALCALLGAAAPTLRAQQSLENVIVETYYVSDANDTADPLSGGGLAQGARTYRVYLDLCEGCALRAVYGDQYHPISIASTSPFFNHADRGRTFGHQLNNTGLGEGTVALDSYLSLGRGSAARLGILKEEDPDGSGIGGANNNQGLLSNSAPEMGLPITQADGLVPLAGAPSVPPGFLVSGDDPAAAFGDETVASSFSSAGFRISTTNPGVTGPTADNRILIAQLTTAGELTFQLNVEVQQPDGAVTRYVSTADTLLPGETLSGLLVFPPDCGCTNPNFLEYDPAAGCDDGSCATPIVFGCLDPAACNYSATANFNVPQLCCYGIDDCNGLDPYLVCPTIGFHELARGALVVAPNPTHGALRIAGAERLAPPLSMMVMDASGRALMRAALRSDGPSEADLSGLAEGPYLVLVQGAKGSATARIIKH